MTLAKDIEPSASSSLPLVLMDIIDVDIYDLKIAFVNHFFQITNLIFKQIVLIRKSRHEQLCALWRKSERWLLTRIENLKYITSTNFSI